MRAIVCIRNIFACGLGSRRSCYFAIGEGAGGRGGIIWVSICCTMEWAVENVIKRSAVMQLVVDWQPSIGSRQLVAVGSRLPTAAKNTFFAKCWSRVRVMST